MQKIEGLNIDFFGRPLCGDCDAAKKVFQESGLEEGNYNYRDVKADPKANLEATNICKGLGRELSVPVIAIHDGRNGASGQIVFVEPRDAGLVALGKTLQALIRR